MRNLLITTLLIISIVLNSFSQGTSLTHLNLSQCIDIVLKNNPDVQRKAISTEASRIRWRQERTNMLPFINGGISHGLNQGRSIDPLTNTYINREITYASPYLEGSLLLFNGMALQNVIKEHSLIYQAAKQEEQQVKDELTLNVILIYLEVLTNQDLLGLARVRRETTVKQVERLEILNKSGAIAPGDYYDLKGQYASDKLSVINAENSLENSKISLVRLLNINYYKDLKLDQLSTGEFSLLYDTSPEEVYQSAILNLASVRAADLRKKSADVQLKSSRSGYFPSVYFNTGVSSSFSNAARDVLNQRIGYFSQFNNNQRKSFSISVSIPLFNAFRTKNDISLARLKLRESELMVQNTHTQLQQLTQQAYFNMTASKDRYISLKDQVDAYTESFRTAEIRFNSGFINSVDYLIARDNLEKAKASMLINRYDFILRKKILDFYQGKPFSM
ncbi:MAG: TolC family protein [Daejeonella sp.]